MGCCTCMPRSTEPGIVLPEEEALLTELEQTHPFASKDVEDLSSVFDCDSLTDNDFYVKCFRLQLSPRALTSGRLEKFKEAFRDCSGLINAHYLRLAGILLGRGSPMRKMSLLVDIYGLESVIDAYQMLQDLAYTSIALTPRMSDNLNVKVYTEGLQNAVPSFIKKISKKCQNVRNRNEFLKLFEKDLHMQKMCWANGIRTILIEEGIKAISAFTLQSTSRTAPGTPKKNNRNFQPMNNLSSAIPEEQAD